MGTMIGREGKAAGSGNLKKPDVRRGRRIGGKRNQQRDADKKTEIPARSHYFCLPSFQKRLIQK
jgi:hypothetical protein